MFIMYSFEGGKGDKRWHHEASDFHRDSKDLKEELVPQHNYKMNAESMQGKAFGEVSCRDYRESIL